MPKLPQIDRQREHQANERTFLAWLRTAIALIGFGFAIARFGIFLQQIEVTLEPTTSQTPSQVNSENIGIGLVLFGITVILVALWNYNRVFLQIEKGNYQPSRLIVLITSMVVVLLGILSLTVMVRNQPNQVQRKFKSSYLPKVTENKVNKRLW